MASLSYDKLFPTGTRVALKNSMSGQAVATVVGWPPQLYSMRDYYDKNGELVVPICTDRQEDPRFEGCRLGDIDHLTGAGRGFFINQNLITPTYYYNMGDIPRHLGVAVPPDRAIIKPESGYTFPSGMIGKLIAESGPMYQISWNINSVKRAGLLNYTGFTSTKAHRFVSVEHKESLCWVCLTIHNDPVIIEWWPNTLINSEKPKINVGDYVIYKGPKPLTYSSDDGQRSVVLRDDVVKIISMPKQGRDGVYCVRVINHNAGKNGEEARFLASTRYLRPFDQKVLEAGTEVIVIANIDFRGQKLEGKRGRVVLATDKDGDVGVEFEEKLRGAGSLDGYGDDGKCLYIPAEALEEKE